MILKITVNRAGQPSLDVDFDHMPVIGEKLVLQTPAGLAGYTVQAITTAFSESPVGWSQQGIVIDVA